MKTLLFELPEVKTKKSTQWVKEDRPDYKLINKGCRALTDTEIIAIIIGEVNSIELSRSILHHCEYNLNNLGRMQISELMSLGLTEQKATRLISCLELGRRRMTAETPERIQVHCSKDVADYMRDVLTDLDHEEFWIILLNRSNKIIGRIRVSSGGIAGTVTDVKIIMRKAIDKLASGLIVCHNHPSGNTKPSEADTRITTKIKEAGLIMDVQLMDHVVISDNDYYSFADNGMI